MKSYYLGASGSEEQLSHVTIDIDTNYDEIHIETRLAGGTLVRDKVAVKGRWQFKWDHLPGEDSDVVDDGIGRNSLQAYYTTGGALSLKVPLEAGGYDTFSVMFSGEFQEKRVQVSPNHAWSVNFGLVEI